MEDYLLDKKYGSHKDSSFEDEVLVLEEEYNGERDIFSQTPRMECSSRGVITGALDRFLETKFPFLMELELELSNNMALIPPFPSNPITNPTKGKLWGEDEDYESQEENVVATLGRKNKTKKEEAIGYGG